MTTEQVLTKCLICNGSGQRCYICGMPSNICMCSAEEIAIYELDFGEPHIMACNDCDGTGDKLP